MEENKNYKVSLKMGWEFIVICNDKDEIKNKIIEYLDVLKLKDGFFSLSWDAKKNLDLNEYFFEEYFGFVLI